MPFGNRLTTIVNTIINILFFIFTYHKFGIIISLYFYVLAILVLLMYYIFNVYSLERGKYTLIDFLNIIIINLAMALFLYRSMDAKNTILLFLSVAAFQNITKIIAYRFFIKVKNLMIVGNNENAKTIKRILGKKSNYVISAELSSEEYDKLDSIVKKENIGKIVVTDVLPEQNFTKKILDLKLKGIQVFNFVDFYERIEEKVPVLSISEEYILFGTGYDILHASLDQRIKRLFDLILAFVVMVITFPIMIIAAIIVKVESKGPIFFSQSRIGLGNESFQIYKFRSMKLHDENEHSKYAQDGDNRITKFGKIMRKTRIDELPQLWNVIKGDMSFIGPRAEWDKLCYEYMEKIPFYNIRHSVKPGLTGWAQVRYPYGMGVEDALEKLRYDLYYIKHQNLAFDIMILFQTVKIVIFGRGK